jgi:hypothetical protein
MTAMARPAAIVNDRAILSLVRMFHKDYNRKDSAGVLLKSKIAVRWFQGACRQDGLAVNRHSENN